MKNEKNPKEIVLIYMHGLNLLPVAKQFKQWLANYLPGSRLPSGAMLIRVREGHDVMHSLKWGRDLQGIFSFGMMPVTFLLLSKLQLLSQACLFLAQFKTVGHNKYAGISTRLFREKDFQGAERESRF